MGLLHLLVLVPDYQIDAAVGEHQLLQILFLGVFDAVRKSAVETGYRRMGKFFGKL